ncbi:MAG: hypothetical protein ACP5T9_04060 [Thermoplasmata archaeon]
MFRFSALPENISSSLFYNQNLLNVSNMDYSVRFGQEYGVIPPSVDIKVNVLINYSQSDVFMTKVATVDLNENNNFTVYLNESFAFNDSLHFLSYFTHIYNQSYLLFFAINTGFSASSGIIFLNNSIYSYNISVPLKYEPFVWAGLYSIMPFNYSSNSTLREQEMQSDVSSYVFDAGYPVVYPYALGEEMIYNWTMNYGGRYLTNIAPEGATVSGWPYQSNVSTPQENGHWIDTFFTPSIRGVNYQFVEPNFTAYVMAYPPGKVSTYTVFIFSGNTASQYNLTLYSNSGYIDYSYPYYGNGKDILYKDISPNPVFHISLPSDSGNVTFEAVVNYTDGNSLFMYSSLFVYQQPRITVVQLNGSSFDYIEIKEYNVPSLNESGFGLNYNNLGNLSIVYPNGTAIPLNSSMSLGAILGALNKNISLKVNSLPDPVTPPNNSVKQYFSYPFGAVFVDGAPYFSDYAYGLFNNYEPYRLPNWMMFQPTIWHNLYNFSVPSYNGAGWLVLKVPRNSIITFYDIFGNEYLLKQITLNARNSSFSISVINNLKSGYYVFINGSMPDISINFNAPFYGEYGNASGVVVISGFINGLNYSTVAVISYYLNGTQRNITIYLYKVNNTLVGNFTVPASAGYFTVTYNSSIPFIGIIYANANIPISNSAMNVMVMLSYIIFGGLLLLIAYIFIWVRNKLYNREKEEGVKK